MFERILVPLDGSQEAESVFQALQRLVARRNADVILFRSVTLTSLVEITDSGTMCLREDAEAPEYLERTRRRLEKAGIPASTMVVEGPPADSILRAARDREVSLIAMSTHGRSGFLRWMLGSVTEEILRRSPIPVYVSNANPSEIRIAPGDARTILVPFDGTEDSLSVAPLAIETARLFEAGVAILKVEEAAAWGREFGFVGHLMDGPVRLEGQAEILDRDLVEAGNRFAREGVRTTLYRVRGETVWKINQLAAMLPAGMIMMASHGRRGVSRLFSGSVAEEVVRKAEVPVVVQRIGSAPSMAAIPERRVS